MKQLATFFSYLLHPVFVPFVIFLVLHAICPGLFGMVDAKTIGLWKIQTGFNTILYPLLVIVLIWKLGFAKNMHMETNQERLGPLMACILFYFWNFYVFHKAQTDAPLALRSFLLGSFLSVCILFMTTIFTKMSLHTTAWAGVVTFFFLQSFTNQCAHIFSVASIIAFALLTIVIYSRMILLAHTRAEIVSGLLIGIICQVGVYFFYT